MAGSNQPCSSSSNDWEFHYLVIYTYNKVHQIAVMTTYTPPHIQDLLLLPNTKNYRIFFMIYVHCELTCTHFVSADGSLRQRRYSTGEVTEKEYCHARKVSLMMCRCVVLLCFPQRNQSFIKKNCMFCDCAPHWLWLNYVFHDVRCVCMAYN